MNEKILKAAGQAIFDKKGFDILCFDVRGVSGLTDFVIIGSASVDKHLKALAREVEGRLLQESEKLTYSEGYEVGEWIILDYIGLIVHLTLPAIRDEYALEELWKQGKIVDLKIEV